MLNGPRVVHTVNKQFIILCALHDSGHEAKCVIDRRLQSARCNKTFVDLLKTHFLKCDVQQMSARRSVGTLIWEDPIEMIFPCICPSLLTRGICKIDNIAEGNPIINKHLMLLSVPIRILHSKSDLHMLLMFVKTLEIPESWSSRNKSQKRYNFVHFIPRIMLRSFNLFDTSLFIKILFHNTIPRMYCLAITRYYKQRVNIPDAIELFV